MEKKFIHPAKLPRKKKGSDGTTKKKPKAKKTDTEGSGKPAEHGPPSDPDSAPEPEIHSSDISKV